MDKLVIGILAHVDAGKTTLSESLLFCSGKIGKLGRVDNKDSYLDNFELERARGITIFSKQAVFETGNFEITLLDTPGHVDFSAEMERTLKMLDYAILVISGADGVQAHTKTLWRLLERYNIPVFLFVNKMDQIVADKQKLTKEIKKHLDEKCILFETKKDQEFYEQLAMCDEKIMEEYLEKENIDTEIIKKSIKERNVFPCFFGSALKLQGIEEFLQAIGKYTIAPSYTHEFGAKIFKITRDEQGNRLTHMKITGGKLKVKDILKNKVWEEKVNQIRIYSGQKFVAENQVEAGTVCAVTGLSKTIPGECMGTAEAALAPVLEPVLFYQMILPEGCDPRMIMPKLRMIEEEEPELHIIWDEQLQEIQVRIMGEVQLEILSSLIENRFGIKVGFNEGRILYKETIKDMAYGVGHFEPLRHYAEVHLLLEPGKAGSGLEFKSECSEDILGKNWQNLVLTHLQEKSHKGVLTGSEITDMKITLVSGKSNNKHTEGGDFREATYRAVRQGMKEAESILLEPYYSFEMELPEKMVGRAMTDIEKISGFCQILKSDGEISILSGSAPVIAMRNYHKDLTAYTKGKGRLFCSLKGYEPCHNTEEVIENFRYDSERDFQNPTGSVFCANGAGFSVEWDQVKKHMHLESYIKINKDLTREVLQNQLNPNSETSISLSEIDQIFNRTFYANQGKKSVWKRNPAINESHYETSGVRYAQSRNENLEEYMLVDGYNIIFAWPELKELADLNMDSAKLQLLDILSNYQSFGNFEMIVVFDAYRVEGHREELFKHHNINIVYTKEAQTADQYIEKFAHDNKKKYNIVVATSDGMEQLIIRGSGCRILSARELLEDVESTKENIRREYEKVNQKDKKYLIDALKPEMKQMIESIIKEDE